ALAAPAPDAQRHGRGPRVAFLADRDFSLDLYAALPIAATKIKMMTMVNMHRHARHRLANGFLLFLLAGNLAAAMEDWPRFLGPHANGTSRETGLIDKWGAEGPAKVWSISVGTGYSDPSVLWPDLLLHHRLGDQEIVECFDAETGKSKWRHPYPSQFIDP